MSLAVEQAQLFIQFSKTMPRQSLFQIFNHCSQASHDLQITCTVRANFAECQIHEVIPIWRPEDYTQLTILHDLVGTQMSLSNQPQQPMKLVNSKDSGCRVVYRWGERL